MSGIIGLPEEAEAAFNKGLADATTEEESAQNEYERTTSRRSRRR